MEIDAVSQAEAERLSPCDMRCRERDDIHHDTRCSAIIQPRIASSLSTLRARIAELEQAVTKPRDTFKHYGDLHAAKPDEVKAKRNYDLADEMQRALSGEREG